MSESVIKVRKKKKNKKVDSTDLQMLSVVSSSETAIYEWDKHKIVQALIKEAACAENLAMDIAEAVENTIKSTGRVCVSSDMIRELVNDELYQRGESGILEKQSVYSIPKYDIDQLIFSKSTDNSNLSNNTPGAVALTIAEIILKRHALATIFSKDVADAHMVGKIYLHDLGAACTKIYCGSHSVAAILKNGLDVACMSNTSAPAKSAQVLVGQLNTFISLWSGLYAGALGIADVNTIFAPLLVGMDYKEIKQVAQYLVYSFGQNAFSRNGGEVLFVDLNMNFGISAHLSDVEAIGAGGVKTGKTYSEYVKEARLFSKAVLEIVREGDSQGKILPFPKANYHINAETFSDPDSYALFLEACEVAAYNGNVYFQFDRAAVTLSSCCRLKATITDNEIIKNPDQVRFAGICNTTLNLPQMAYRCKGDKEKLWQDIDETTQLAIKATIQRKEYLRKIITTDGAPLRQLGRAYYDGKPYVDLDKSTYIIGVLGLNELVQRMIGKELHDGDEAVEFGLQVMSRIYFNSKEAANKYDMHIVLEESPAESCNNRLCKCDRRYYPESEQYMHGANGAWYYTNSIHLRPDAPVDIIERVRVQSLFAPLFEAGSVVHCFTGDSQPSASAIASLMQKTFENTQCNQLTISPEYTFCDVCGNRMLGLKSTCSKCGSKNIAAHHCLPCGEADGATIRAKFDEWQKICEK